MKPRSILCVIDKTDDALIASQKIKEAWAAVVVVTNPSLLDDVINHIDLSKSSINVLPLDTYLSRSSWTTGDMVV